MVDIKEETPFSFEVPLTPTTENVGIDSATVEAEIAASQPEAPKKRGRKPGTVNKKKEETVSNAEIEMMFGPLVVAAHNGLLKLLKLSTMDSEQEKTVSKAYSIMLSKRAPEFLEMHGDYIAAFGATALVFGGKLMTETEIFKPKTKVKENIDETSKQHNNDTGAQGFWKDGAKQVPNE